MNKHLNRAVRGMCLIAALSYTLGHDPVFGQSKGYHRFLEDAARFGNAEISENEFFRLYRDIVTAQRSLTALEQQEVAPVVALSGSRHLTSRSRNVRLSAVRLLSNQEMGFFKLAEREFPFREEFLANIRSVLDEYPDTGLGRGRTSRPSLMHVVLLLGVHGTPGDIGLVRVFREEKPEWLLEARMAAARLGDEEEKKALIDEFIKAGLGSERRDLAYALGYVGADDCLRALCEALNSDETVERAPHPGEQLTYHIVNALLYQRPRDGLFYRNYVARTEADVVALEECCQERFGITWDPPRPPLQPIEPNFH